MKPILLELKGVKDFREKQIVDFSGQIVRGIFEKSSDANAALPDYLLLALFGSVEAFGDAEQLIHPESKFAVTTLRYAVSGKTYELTRTFYRKSESKATLTELSEDGASASIGESAEDVSAAVDRQIGLAAEEFRNCTVLPQRGLHGVLNKPYAEKEATVAKLFGCGKYGKQLEKQIADARRAADCERSAYKAALKELGECSDEAAERLTQRFHSLKQELEDRAEQCKAAEAQAASAEKLFEQNAEAERMRGVWAKSEETLPAVRKLEDKLKLGAKAAVILPEKDKLDGLEAELSEKRDKIAELQNQLHRKNDLKKLLRNTYHSVKQRFYDERSTYQQKLRLLEETEKRIAEMHGKEEALQALVFEKNKIYEVAAQKKGEYDALSDLLQKSEGYVEELGQSAVRGDFNKETARIIALLRELEVEKRVLEDSLISLDQRIDERKTRKEKLSVRAKQLMREKTEKDAKLAEIDRAIQAESGVDSSRYEAVLSVVHDNMAKRAVYRILNSLEQNIQRLKAVNDTYCKRMNAYVEQSEKEENKSLSYEKNIAYLEELKKSQSTEPAADEKTDKNAAQVERQMRKRNLDQTDKKLLDMRAMYAESESARRELEARADELQMQISVNTAELSNLTTERENLKRQYSLQFVDPNSILDDLSQADGKEQKLEQLMLAATELDNRISAILSELEECVSLDAEIGQDMDSLYRVQADSVARVDEIAEQMNQYGGMLSGKATSVAKLLEGNDGKRADALLKLAEQKQLRASCAESIAELEKEIHLCETAISTLSAKIEAAQTEIAALSASVGEVIPQDTTAEEIREEYLAKLESIRAKETRYTEKFSQLETLIAALEENIAKQKGLYELKQKQCDAAREAVNKMLAEQGFAPDENIEAYRMNEENVLKVNYIIRSYFAGRESLEQRMTAMPERISEEQLGKVKRHAAELAAHKQETEKALVLLGAELSELQRNRSRAAQIGAQLEALAKRESETAELAAKLNASGLPAEMAQSCMKLTVDEANAVLSKLTGGAYTLSLEDDLYVSNAAEKKFKSGALSGEDAFLVKAALALAIRKLLLKKNGATGEFLMIKAGHSVTTCTTAKQLADYLEAETSGSAAILLQEKEPAEYLAATPGTEELSEATAATEI